MSTKSSLSQEFISQQRRRLEALKAGLLSADDDALRDSLDQQETTGSEATEYEEAAQAMDRKEVLQSRHEVDQHRLVNIERALKKIELGTYGISDASGKPIPQARLEATPEATLTVEEAAAKE